MAFFSELIFANSATHEIRRKLIFYVNYMFNRWNDFEYELLIWEPKK